jgi:hypothetical protein
MSVKVIRQWQSAGTVGEAGITGRSRMARSEPARLAAIGLAAYVIAT